MEKWERRFIAGSSVPLDGGGDTHFHAFGPKESDFTVTTRIPIGQGFEPVAIHDRPVLGTEPMMLRRGWNGCPW